MYNGTDKNIPFSSRLTNVRNPFQTSGKDIYEVSVLSVFTRV